MRLRNWLSTGVVGMSLVVLAGCKTWVNGSDSLVQATGHKTDGAETVPGLQHAVGLAIGSSIFCSGTLISPSQVVTAAHCFQQGDVTVVFGVDYKNSQKLPGLFLTFHPDYEGKLAYDVAIVQLKEKVPEAWGYVPARPANSIILGKDKRFTIIGYGRGFDVDAYDALKKEIEEKDYSPLKRRALVNKFFVEEEGSGTRRFVTGAYGGFAPDTQKAFRVQADQDSVTGMQTYLCYGDSGGGVYLVRGGDVYWAGVACAIEKADPKASVARLKDCEKGWAIVDSVPELIEWLDGWRNPLRFNTESRGRTVIGKPKKVFCNYPKYDQGHAYRISSLEIKIGDYVSTVTYWYHLTGWRDPQMTYQVANQHFQPILDRLQRGELSDDDIAFIMSQGVAPMTVEDGKWKISRCFVKG